MLNIFAYILILIVLVLLLYDYRSGIITSLMVLTNFGEFAYVNPNLKIGDFAGSGSIYFMDLFWIALLTVIFLKRDKLNQFNYKLAFLILLILFISSIIIPLLINSFSVKDSISVIRPLGNFLFLPYFVLLVTDLKEFNFLEKTITAMVFVFIVVQIYEYITQTRIPFKLIENDSLFYGDEAFSVKFSGVKTGYIWTRIAVILPFNLLFGCYYYFTDKKYYGLLLIALYLLSVMISLSRIWIIGLAFFVIVISAFLIFKNNVGSRVKYNLFALVGSFALIGVILFFTSSTFNQIVDIFLLRVNSINDLADKTDSSFLGREYVLLQMIGVWMEYPVFGAGFSSISRKLITNDLGFPNIITIFGTAGMLMFTVFIIQYYKSIRPFFKSEYILFAVLSSLMSMLIIMSVFSLDMFYFNATGAILFALGNILSNIAKQEPEENVNYNYAA